jgi:hypothetical protein
MITPIKIGISSCLLGNKVRGDAGHKLDRFLKDTLGEFVEPFLIFNDSPGLFYTGAVEESYIKGTSFAFLIQKE